jgi:putative peptidoglycan lipid II flippase
VGTISSSQVAWLGLGTTAGFVAQALILIPVIKNTGIRIRPRWDWRDPSMKKSLHLASWTLAFAAISQISYLITVNISTRAAVHALKAGVTTGVGFSPYSNALLIFMLPHSVITISVVTALLPALAKYVIDKKPNLVHDELVKAIRLVGIITVPSSIAFLLFGPVITQALFVGIPTGDAQYIGRVLAALGLGLAPMSVNLIALRGLNAFENVKLQVLSNFIMNAIGALLCVGAELFLAPKWVTVGLGAALSASYFVGAWWTIRVLRRYEVNIKIRETAFLYAKLAIAALLISVPLFLLQSKIPGGKITHLILLLGVSGLGYLGIAKLLRINEVTNLFNLLLKRKTTAQR